jgi:hypothetical protein
MKYINDEMTEITIETDVFQTWQFDIIYKPMFVEREHVSDDTIGLHTIPEGLETGEYIIDSVDYALNMTEYAYVLQFTKTYDGREPANLYTNYGGIPMVGGAYAFQNYADLITMINNYPSTQGQTASDAIYNAYMIPKAFMTYNFPTAGNPLDLNTEYQGDNTPLHFDEYISKPSTLDTYIPVNNKLFTFPYCFIVLSNNDGTNNILHYEKFSSSFGHCRFRVIGVPTINGSIKCCPMDYDNVSMNEAEGIMAGKFPTLNWSKENFGDWLIYNGNKQTATLHGGTFSTGIGLGLVGASIATGGTALLLAGATMAIAGITAVLNALATYQDHAKVPDSAVGNNLGGDLATANKTNTFYFYSKSIKREYAEIIDRYFSIYGYKVNKVEIPNLNSRVNWNYIKTVDCNLEGTEIPEKDIEELKKMFDKGITLWHNYTAFRDYRYTNPIIT